MVDGVRSRGQKLTREVVDAITGGNTRATRLIENLTADVGETLPDSVDTAQAAAETAQDTADDAATAAANAQTAANDAQTDATDALDQIGTLSAIQYLTLAASAPLANERVLTAGAGITFVDAGPGGALTVSIAANASLKDSLNATIVQVADGALGLFGVTPTTRPTTAGASATFSAGAGAAVNDASTFDGYTIAQVVKALRTLGLLT